MGLVTELWTFVWCIEVERTGGDEMFRERGTTAGDANSFYICSKHRIIRWMDEYLEIRAAIQYP